MVWSHPSYHLDWNSFLQNCRLEDATLRRDSSQGASRFTAGVATFSIEPVASRAARAASIRSRSDSGSGNELSEAGRENARASSANQAGGEGRRSRRVSADSPSMRSSISSVRPSIARRCAKMEPAANCSCDRQRCSRCPARTACAPRFAALCGTALNDSSRSVNVSPRYQAEESKTV